MKLNITKGLFLIGAVVALSSCSTQNKLASAKSDSYDDVYNTTAKAGDQPVYAERMNSSTYRHDNYTTTVTDDGDDYYTYDSYSARLNRFYNSPFALSYYDNLYYGGVNPYFVGLNPYYSGLSLSLGYGIGSGYYGGYYSPYAYNPYYSYSPYYGYGYGYGLGYGSIAYGGGYYGSGYGGVYSYYNTVGRYGVAKPYRGSGLANTTYPGRSGGYTPPANTRQPRTTSVNPYPGNNQPTVQQTRQTYQPQPQPQSQPSYQPSSGSSSSSSSGSSNSGGGGGRPIRP